MLTPWRSRRKARYQMATQMNMAAIRSVETAAPYPNRLFENDCRMISVISRSADGPGFEPSMM